MDKKRLSLLVAGAFGLSVVGFVLVRVATVPKSPSAAATAPRPEGPATAPLAEGPSLAWLSDEEAARKTSKESGKPILLDFTATWCEACHEMERTVFKNPEVMAKLKASFVLLRLDVSEETPVTAKILDRYGVEALPTVLVVDATGKRLPLSRDLSTQDANGFLEVLKSF